jgi:hypothetical protein
MDLANPSPNLDEPPSPEPPVPDLRGETGATLGARIAGVVLCLNAVFSFAELTVPGASRPDAGMLHSPVAFLIDLGLGVALLRGMAKWQKIALARVGIGAVVFTGVALVNQDWFGAATQALFSLSLAGLLWKNAGKARLGAAAAVAGLVFIVEALGLYMLHTGKNPIANAVLTLRDDIEPQSVSEVHGERSTWRLTAPPGKWYLRKGPAAAKDNALVDRWLVDPAHDSHLLVIGIPTEPGAAVNIDEVMKGAIDDVKGAPDFRILEAPAPLSIAGVAARIAHTVGTTNGIRVETLAAVLAGNNMIYQITGFASPETYPVVSAELKQMIQSFQPK